MQMELNLIMPTSTTFSNLGFPMKLKIDSADLKISFPQIRKLPFSYFLIMNLSVSKPTDKNTREKSPEQRVEAKQTCELQVDKQRK